MIRPPVRSVEQDAGLPFHPTTLSIAVLRLWPFLLLWAAISVFLSVSAGLALGSRSYTAETVLLHRPRPSDWARPGEPGLDSLSLVTKLNLVYLGVDGAVFQ